VQKATALNVSWCMRAVFVLNFCAPVLHARPAGTVTGSADTNTVGGLAVTTTPREADVFVDGRMMGRTPVLLPRIPAGIRQLRLTKAGFCDFSDTVTILEGVTASRRVEMDSACGLVVNTVPDSAAVYVENVFIGRSPLRLSNEHGGWKTVKVMKLNKAPWEDHIFLAPGTTVTVNATLKSKFGTLTVDVFSNDVDVLIDGRTASQGSLTDFMIPGGMHDIGARNADSSAIVTETAYISPGETVHFQARFGKPTMAPFLWSMALPGLGQAVNGSPGKGLIFLGGFAAACVFTATMNSRYQGELGQYNAAVDQYRKATTEDAAKGAGDNLASQYQRLNSPYRLRTAGIVLAGAVYVFSLVDAFLNHSTVNTMTQTASRSTGAWSPEASVSPSGGDLTLRIEF